MIDFPNEANRPMNEAPAPQTGGIGNPTITGGDDPETVQLKKKQNAKLLLLFMGVGIVVITFVGWFLLTMNSKTTAGEDVKPKTTASITATDEYKRQIPDIAPPKPAPAPVPEVRPEPAPAPAPVQVVEAVPVQTQPLVQPPKAKPEKTGPTLLEKKLSAPMMGDGKAINNLKPVDVPKEGPQDNTGDGGKLGEMMTPMKVAAGSAYRAKNRHLTLSQGTFINCVMETAVDTTVPGMTACRIPENIFSMDGRTLLIERGSRVFGEYRGAVAKGMERIFLLWTKIETPNGVIINIDSPSTDGLGRAGATGEVNHHWFRRFGNALLFSILDDGFNFAMDQARDNGNGVNYYQSSQSGMESLIQELVREGTDIPPTMRMNQGTRIGIFVARSIDMSNVYRLEAR